MRFQPANSKQVKRLVLTGLLCLLGTQVHICPKCKNIVKRKTHECSYCGEKYPFAVKVPLYLLKDIKNGIATEALHYYVHTYIFPHLSEIERLYLTQYFTIVLVQGGPSNPARGTSTSSSISVTMALTPIQGNLLIAVIGTFASSYATVSSITQTGVTWTGLGNPQAQFEGATLNPYYEDCEIWVGVVGSSAQTSITINLAVNADFGGIADVCEWSGLATSSFLDQVASNGNVSTGTTTPDTGQTPITNKASELAIGAIMVTGSLTPTQGSPTNGFTMLDGAYDGLYSSLAYLYNILSSTGQQQTSTTIPISPTWFAGCIATFKAVSVTYTYQLVENLTFQENIYKRTRAKRRSTEVTYLKDSVSKVFAISRRLVEKTLVQDVFKRKAVYKRLQQENLAFRDIFSFREHIKKRKVSFVANLSISEVNQRKIKSKRRQIETLTIRDTAKKSTNYRRNLAETLKIQDIFKRGKAIYKRLQQEPLAFQDSFTRKISYKRKLVEQAVLMDKLTRKLNGFRSWIENLTVQDAFSYIYVKFVNRYFRLFVENLLVNDALNRLVTYSRSLVESISYIFPSIAGNLVLTPNNFGSGTSWEGYCDLDAMANFTPGQTAPDSSLTANKVVCDSTAGVSCGIGAAWGALQFFSASLIVSQIYTVSIWLKGAAGGESFSFGLSDYDQTGVTLTNQWQFYTFTTVCSNSSRGCQFKCNTPNATYYVWNPQVTQISPPPYSLDNFIRKINYRIRSWIENLVVLSP